LIVMLLDDTKGVAVDDNYQQMLVVFNSSDKEKNIEINDAGSFELHPALKNSPDKRLADIDISKTSVSIPPLSSVVLTK